MPETKEASPVINELPVEKRKHARKIFRGLADAMGLRPKHFEVVRVDESKETEPEVKLKPGDDGYDGEGWVEASAVKPPRYAVTNSSNVDIPAGFQPNQFGIVEIQVGANEEKGINGWSELAYVSIPNGQERPSIYVDIPQNI